MAIHTAPPFRSREDAMEAAGLISRLQSQGIYVLRAQELSGLVPKVIPIETFIFNGVSFTPGPTTGTP